MKLFTLFVFYFSMTQVSSAYFIKCNGEISKYDEHLKRKWVKPMQFMPKKTGNGSIELLVSEQKTREEMFEYRLEARHNRWYGRNESSLKLVYKDLVGDEYSNFIESKKTTEMRLLSWVPLLNLDKLKFEVTCNLRP